MPVTLYTICDEGTFVYGGWKRFPSQTCRTHKHTNASHLTDLNDYTGGVTLKKKPRSVTTQKVIYTHPAVRRINKHTQPPTHTQTDRQWMTQSHLLLIGAFTDTRCTRRAPAGSPLVFTLTEPLKDTQVQWNDFLVPHSTTRPQLDSHQNTWWKLVYW